MIKAVDLFCGIGGLTRGLEDAGINVVKGYDFEPSVEHAYKNNNNAKFQLQDISDLEVSEVLNELKGSKYTLVAGCAPCQPFSSYQKDKDIDTRRSHYKYMAFHHFMRIVRGVKPTFVTMENVRGILKDENFDLFVNDLKDMGYSVDYKVVDISKYGAPQKRNRMLLVASLIGEINLPTSTTDKTLSVEEAIGHLKPIKAGEVDKNDPLHRSSNLSDLNVKRIKASKPGGTWRDWPSELLPECYKRESGKTFSSVYGRADGNKPANTLTTQFTRYGTGRYGHYKQNRAYSLREGAILQTFPENYDFGIEELGSTKVAMHIGNAVPPIAGKVIGEVMLGVING